MRRTNRSTIGNSHGPRDRQVLLVKDLDDETLELIRNTQPCERSKELGRRLKDPGAG